MSRAFEINALILLLPGMSAAGQLAGYRSRFILTHHDPAADIGNMLKEKNDPFRRSGPAMSCRPQFR